MLQIENIKGPGKTMIIKRRSFLRQLPVYRYH